MVEFQSCRSGSPVSCSSAEAGINYPFHSTAKAFETKRIPMHPTFHPSLPPRSQVLDLSNVAVPKRPLFFFFWCETGREVALCQPDYVSLRLCRCVNVGGRCSFLAWPTQPSRNKYMGPMHMAKPGYRRLQVKKYIIDPVREAKA